MAATRDIAIIGAGIVGAACAAEMAGAGLSVTVIDPGPVGGGATGAGMGQIVAMDDSEAQFALTHYSRRLWDAMLDELPPECEVDRCGTVWIAADAEELDAARAKEAFYRERGAEAETLDENALREAEPNLRPGLAGGLLVPGDSVIYTPTAALWLIERAKRMGAEILLGRRAVEFGEGSVKLDNGTRVEAGAVVLATGAGAAAMLPGLQVRPRKGHLVITDRHPGFIRHQVVELGYLKSAHGSANESVAFNVQPRATGQLLIGSSRQYGAQGTEVESRVVGRMLRRAFEFVPGLRDLRAIRVWAGMRAATPDSLPIIGPCPGRERLYLATGHEGLGITTSMGTARLLTDLIAGRETEIPVGPYLPERFEAVATHG